MSQENIESTTGTGKGMGIGLGIGIAIIVILVLVMCVCVAIFCLLGPAVGNVFSNIVENLEMTPVP